MNKIQVVPIKSMHKPIRNIYAWQFGEVSGLPKVHKSSLSRVKEIWPSAYVVRCGDHLYNVDSKPEVYENAEEY